MTLLSLYITKQINGNKLYPINAMKKSNLWSLVKNCTAVIYVIMILTAFYGLTSCQKVISIDLNSTSPQLVVEANVSNQPVSYFVKLSNTVNFSEITEIPVVTGATVDISDSSGIGETLKEVRDGVYQTGTLIGIPGHTYKLTIKTGGQTYESVSKMPYPVGNLNLELKREADNGNVFGGGSGNISWRYVINYEFKDPGEYKNYYRFVVYYKNGIIGSHRVFDDQYHNGKIISDDFELRDSVNLRLRPGDTVMIELQNISSGAYNFFRTLREGAGGMSFLSASPSNPISNISNEGLGYFNVYSVTDRMMIIP
jgi:hypothetical protein